MKHNISLYTVYHKSSHIIKNEYIKPIQVGNAKDILGVDYRDNQGDNISGKNPTYCELTAQYWAWKNDRVSDYIGIMHYRRFFDFNKQESRELNKYGLLEEPKFTLDFAKNYGLDEKNIEEQVIGYDLILPVEWDVRAVGWKNIRDNYINSIYHHKKDLDITRDVIKDIYPEYLNEFDCVMNSSSGYFTNIFVLRKNLFDSYSEWLFNVLFEVERRIDISSYDTQERRVFGYLSERLFNVWLSKLFKDNKELKINYLRRVFLHNTDAKYWFANKITTTKDIVSVVIASDGNYVPHLGALISSIVDNLSQNKFLDLIILDGGISIEDRKRLSRLVRNIGNIQFLELESEFSNQSIHMHFSKATFYRLILDKLVLERDKILYIDCDTIVLDDISKLFEIDLEGKAIGAVFDYIMHHFCQVGVRSIDFTGGMRSKEYLEKYVGLSNNWNKYFQAGVILFNLKELRELDLSTVMIKSLLDKRYWFLDQDILNKYFLNNVKYIDPRWNVVNVGNEIYDGLSDNQINELKEAENNPAILHYAGYEAKPWNNRNAKLGEYYFYYLRKTFWYEKVMFNFQNTNTEIIAIPERSVVWRLSRKFWLLLPYGIKKRLNRLKEYLKNKL